MRVALAAAAPALLAALLATSGCKRSPKPERTPLPAASAPEAPIDPGRDGDALVIDKLRESGADLKLSRQVDFYLYFPDEPAANRVAAMMRGEGYTVEVRAPTAEIPDWACLAHKSMLVSLSRMHEARARLTSLAEQFGGEYDGWEAPVKP